VYPVGVQLTMTSVGFAKRNYKMMHETFDAELEVEVTDNTWLTVCADILTDGYICYETWKDLPPEITLEIEPQFRIKYLYDEEGNEYSPNLLTDEQYKSIMDRLVEDWFETSIQNGFGRESMH